MSASRSHWYRLRVTVSEMNYPAQRLTELQMRLAVTRQQIALPAAPNRVI